ncbi:hypothetical protein PoB_007149600 [Plakobranchus ocellatus]|uniref:Uncharacterized protein n=1 Tax=Plakobranchus ocellatus TaxID=259542 RepID=A0AAV4DLE3_9GAST|nr:hypothetical protein PoB_007149600 [Plakobranchus ocellatus]
MYIRRSWHWTVRATVTGSNPQQKNPAKPGASPQQGDLRLSGLPSGQDASGGARTRDRRVPADRRAYSLATVPPAPRKTKAALNL